MLLIAESTDGWLQTALALLQHVLT